VPSISRGGARLHFDDLGDGELVVMIHGLNENALYWSTTGIAGRLSGRYRVVLLEMRGHGRSVVSGSVPGYDATTLGEDVMAIADHLGRERFHLISHATGGMVAVRLAMRDDRRLASLTLTDTGAATWPGREDPREAMAPRFEGRSWDEIFASLHQQPGLFLTQLDAHPERDRLWTQFEEMARLGDPDVLAAFIRSFYDDRDPHVELLRSICCPTLVLLGEQDRLFVKPSRLLAEEIPGAELVILPGVGHMTAFEAPEATYAAIASFLAAHPVRGETPAPMPPQGVAR
jgi:pimeloyl-ACP methyl ester carboxylesterase